MKLLEVKNLSIDFAAGNRILSMVDRFSFDIEAGEILALVGESGCGKSISCLALTRLLPSPPAIVHAEAIEFHGRGGNVELASAPLRQLRKIRGGGIAYIFQEPAASLNPVFRIGDQIAEVIELHRPEVENVRAEVIRLLREVGIPDPENRIDAFPHELSGGMQQRVMIAMALGGRPELLIADEPTTALDVTIQAQILELIDRMRRDQQMAVILVTHNLGIVAETADRVAVMYAGCLAESGTTAEILQHPAHPYTAALLSAVPRSGATQEKLTTIPGNVPPPGPARPQCRFFGRCVHCDGLSAIQRQRCENETPRPVRINRHHQVSCHWPLEVTEENES